ncbi:MAG: hypothetical protein IT359_10730 [Gemmatimonadaceae bacterium]|nr:hypothetical protein [Gemmatimonadaceae bacterium]
MRRSTFSILGLAGIAAGLALMSRLVAGRLLEASALVAMGLSGLALAADGARTGSQVVAPPAARHARFEGRAAFWGSVWIALLGAAIAACGIAWGAHAERELLDLLRARPGIVLLPAGVAWGSSGRARWLGWHLTNHPERLRIRSPIGGGFAMGAAVVVVGIGVLELTAPALFDAWLVVAWRALPLPPLGSGSAS